MSNNKPTSGISEEKVTYINKMVETYVINKWESPTPAITKQEVLDVMKADGKVFKDEHMEEIYNMFNIQT